MIDLNLQASVSDGTRRFDLEVRMVCDAPIVALYGPSGAGKSLTLQAIAGLLRPHSGHIRVAGRTLFDARSGVDLPSAQRRVGYLFQDYALFPHLSVRQNVAFGLTSWWRRRPTAAQAQRLDAMLESFGLSSMADSRPANLSGGQQQRVALARALVCAPDVLLLDEPFASLNPMLRESMRRELAQACQRWQTPALMITHDVEDVVALADVVFVFDHGRVVREVNIRAGRSRERVRAELVPEAAPASVAPEKMAWIERQLSLGTYA